MIYLFSFITHTKSSKIVLSGELANNKPFGTLLKGLLFFLNYFTEKEGFFKRFTVLINMINNIICEITKIEEVIKIGTTLTGSWFRGQPKAYGNLSHVFLEKIIEVSLF